MSIIIRGWLILFLSFFLSRRHFFGNYFLPIVKFNVTCELDSKNGTIFYCSPIMTMTFIFQFISDSQLHKMIPERTRGKNVTQAAHVHVSICKMRRAFRVRTNFMMWTELPRNIFLSILRQVWLRYDILRKKLSRKEKMVGIPVRSNTAAITFQMEYYWNIFFCFSLELSTECEIIV